MLMKNKFMLVSFILVTAFILAACAKTATPTNAPVVETTMPSATEVVPTPTLDPNDPANVTGDISSAGSSTVYPLSEAIQALFESEGYTGQHTIASVGTGGGFERFCKTGETDIANASRKIKDSELALCAAINRTPIQFRVGTDAIAVVVSKANTFLANVTTEELAKILASDAKKWSDVNPSWPVEDILRFTPGTDSGTFDFFVETIVQKPLKLEKLEDAKALSLAVSNLQTSEDDNVLVQGVEGSPYAIGYFGFAYFKEQEANLKTVSINDITPTFETAENGTYQLSRPLFIYSDAAILKAKPQVAAFINFYLNRVNEVIGEVGYFPASDAALAEAKTSLEVALQ
jgi:phosphate transport system substrate-binding protein